jgi:hypothetical protein
LQSSETFAGFLLTAGDLLDILTRYQAKSFYPMRTIVTRHDFQRRCYFRFNLRRASPCSTAAVVWLLLSPAIVQATVNTAAYWRLGENDPGAMPGVTVTSTIDSAGTNNLTFEGGAAEYANDVAATAASHTGSSLSINFANGAYATNVIMATNVDNFGIECWAKPTALGGGQVIAYNGSTGGSGDGGWGIIIGSDNNYYGLYGGVTTLGGVPATANVWTHLALVRASGTATLYVNGVAAGTTNAAKPIGPTAGGFALGAPPQSPTSQFFTGLIDEVRVFTFAPGQFSTNDLLEAQAPPVITNIFMVPALTITSGLNVINQIQYSVDLAHSNWVVLTNVLVVQSPYIFADISATNSGRFYRVQQFPNVISPATSTISAPGTITSGSPVGVLLQAEDAAGVKFTKGGDTVVLSVQNGSGSATIGPTTDNGDGTYGATLTGILAGSITVKATVNGNACTNTPSATVVAGAATRLEITPQFYTIHVNGLFAVQAQVKDPAGNLATSFSGTVTLSIQSGPGSLSGTTSAQASSGYANIGAVSVNSSGTYILQVTATGLTTGVGDFTVMP